MKYVWCMCLLPCLWAVSGEHASDHPLVRLQKGNDLVRAGRYEEALALMDGLENQFAIPDPDEFAGAYYNLACVYALHGRPDQALTTLERCMPYAPVSLKHLQSDTDLASLHETPRFQALVHALEQAAAAEEAWLRKPLEAPAWMPAFQEHLPVADRLYGLGRLWSEVKYNFAFFDQVPDLDWDAAYHDMIPRVIAAPDTESYYLLLTEMTARLQDGHTNLFMPKELRDRNGRAAMRTRHIGDQVLVTHVDPALEALGVVVGSAVTAVDGTPVAEHAARMKPYISASTAQDLDYRMYGFFLTQGPIDQPALLAVTDPTGRAFEVRAPRVPYYYRPWERMAFDIGDDRVGVLTINTFSDDRVIEDIVGLWPRIKTCKGLVIDIRNNGGGSTPHWLLERLCTSFKQSAWRTRAYSPTHRAWGAAAPAVGGGGNDITSDSKERYEGPVAVLVDTPTFSAAEDFAAIFQATGRGRLFGLSTGGSTGQPLSFSLPGGGGARVCTKRDTMADGKEFVGFGVHPDETVSMTAAALRSGGDPALEAARAWVHQPTE